MTLTNKEFLKLAKTDIVDLSKVLFYKMFMEHKKQIKLEIDNENPLVKGLKFKCEIKQ